jgi:hypothetical protein
METGTTQDTSRLLKKLSPPLANASAGFTLSLIVPGGVMSFKDIENLAGSNANLPGLLF